MNTLQQTFDPTALTADIRSQSARNETYTINILLNVQGDFTTKKYDPLPFHPNMTTKRNAYPAGIIMFVPIIALKEKDVIAEVGVANDYKSVFTAREKFAVMLKHVIKRDKSRYLLNNNDLEEKNQNYIRIVSENLNLIKDVFFKVNSIIYILGAPYLVRTVTYDLKTFHASTSVTGEELPNLPKKYDITFDLTVIRANENGEVPGRTCKEKAVALNKDSMKLFGKALFSDVIYSEREPKTIFVPTLGLTQEQIDWNRRNTRKDYQARTAAEIKIIDSLKKLDKLQSEYDQIDKQWLAITSNVHEKIFELPEKINKTKADMKIITNKNVADQTPYEKRNLITLKNTLQEQEEALQKAYKELEDLNKEFSETYLEKFKTKVQPILDLYDDLEKLEADLTKLTEYSSSTPEQNQRKNDEITANIEKTTVQLGKLTKADKDKLQNYMKLQQLKKTQPTETAEILDLTNKITDVTVWENILQSTASQKTQLQKERTNESANLRIDAETEKTIKNYILELNIIVAQLEKIEREVNPKPGEKPQFFYPIDIPKAFKDRTELKEKYDKYTRALNKLLGASKKYDDEKKKINDAFQKLYMKGGGTIRKNTRRKNTRRKNTRSRSLLKKRFLTQKRDKKKRVRSVKYKKQKKYTYYKYRRNRRHY
jgi:hypothetical protein